MSRIPREDVWSNYFGSRTSAFCPCCLITPLKLDDDGSTWQRGHIIPHCDQGPDIYENIRPICFDCNSRDRKYETSFHQMVFLGTMPLEDLDPALAKIQNAQTAYIENPQLTKCTATTKNGKPCDNRRTGLSVYCRVHDKCLRTRETKESKQRAVEFLDFVRRTLISSKITGREFQAFRTVEEYLLNEYRDLNDETTTDSYT